MSRASSPSSEPSPLQLRKRAPTKVLLGEDYQQVVTTVYDPPLPLPKDSDYTSARVREGLRYADSVLRNGTRRLSPLGEIALRLYKDSCARYLDIEEGELLDEVELEMVKNEWIATIREHEKSLRYTACLTLTNSKSAQELQDSLVKLVRTQLYARYGDYFAQACTQLKTHAEARKVVGWQSLSRSYWTEISEKIKEEASDYAKILASPVGDSEEVIKLHEKIPTHLAIAHACQAIGFNTKDTIAIIQYYSIRNELMHQNLLPLIEAGKFQSLSKLLHDDLCDLHLVLPPGDRAENNLMQSLVESVIDTWYVRPDSEPDRYNYELWFPSQKLVDYRKELQTKSSVNINQKIREDMISHLRKVRKQKQEEQTAEDELAEAVKIVNLGLNKRGIKRVASVELVQEKLKLEKRRKDWAKVLNLAYNIRECSNTYLETWGDLIPPEEDVIADPLM